MSTQIDLAYVRLLEEDNRRLSEQKSGKVKYNNSIFFHAVDELGQKSLGFGTIIKTVGREHLVNQIYPANGGRQVTVYQESLIAISELDETFRSAEQKIARIKHNFDCLTSKFERLLRHYQFAASQVLNLYGMFRAGEEFLDPRDEADATRNDCACCKKGKRGVRKELPPVIDNQSIPDGAGSLAPGLR